MGMSSARLIPATRGARARRNEVRWAAEEEERARVVTRRGGRRRRRSAREASLLLNLLPLARALHLIYW